MTEMKRQKLDNDTDKGDEQQIIDTSGEHQQIIDTRGRTPDTEVDPYTTQQ